ncbi:sigma-70 family RNA polymerase sigma factor [Dyella humicola]|uniref:sigma-70 family RNA polymerase sigma factor n=1 Tax=Dyella humicola TaxID=2992126 RepID=UPI002252A36D|nr:sigma-70 family RNA polymerase sigma factor [Dyella humicola]
MDIATATFYHLRPRLQGIAYRMLGSVSESEDIVQHAWLRWLEADKASISNAEGWLVATTTRISIDRLRAAKVPRQPCVGIWHPEPVLAEPPAAPQEIEAFSREVSLTFLTALEELPPDVRAAFLLRELFDFGYDEVAGLLGKSEAACGQLVQRAKTLLREGRPVGRVPSEAHQKLMLSFAHALAQGDLAGLASMLADEAMLMDDDGGHVTALSKQIVGGRRIAELLCAGTLRQKSALRVELAMINGQYVVLRYINCELESAQCCENDGECIVRIHVQRNPKELAQLVVAITKRQALLAVCDDKGMRFACHWS